MINITFPDGSVKQFNKGITGFEIVKQISTSLAKEALVIKIDQNLKDLSYPISNDCCIKIITIKDEESLEVIRHDTAHIMAEAVKELYPNIQVTIGPAIENGFYYDFTNETILTLPDLELIEAKMHEIIKRNEQITREVWGRDKAIEFFKSINEHYKAEIISSIPESETVTLYRQGNFVDLCRGPHMPSTNKVKHFKLMKLAGAYWRGDNNNPMLQRIYGTAWATKEQLDNYLTMIEEAEKRDHRKIGRELELFHFQEEAQGMVFWHPNGWSIYLTIEAYIRNKLRHNGYVEVKTPILFNKSLWETSGHWEKFREDMFAISDNSENTENIVDPYIKKDTVPQVPQIQSITHTLAMKPMSCPAHVLLFKQGIKSYRDLPLRMAEFGCCHRNESSGALHGLTRVRAMVQDDAHIFCTEEQIIEETVNFCRLLTEIYNDFGFTNIKIKFSDRPIKRAGSDEVWDKAEDALKNAITIAGYEYILNPGEGAFYGPKLEFILRDAIGREWQCGTFQMDFVLPERFDIHYIAANGKKERPVMLHRAIIGTFERFMGILIEDCAGRFPLWLAPIQVAVINITNEYDDYTITINNKLFNSGVRSVLDISSEKVNYKIRNFSNKKVPIIAIIGKQEATNSTITLRKLGEQEQQEVKVDELIQLIHSENTKYLL